MDVDHDYREHGGIENQDEKVSFHARHRDCGVFLLLRLCVRDFRFFFTAMSELLKHHAPQLKENRVVIPCTGLFQMIIWSLSRRWGDTNETPA